MPDKSNQERRGAQILDLSTGKPGKARQRVKKGANPLVQQTINLSTPRTEQPDDGPSAARDSRGRASPERGERSAPDRRQGNSLADFLDPDVLAKLRGGE